MANDSLINAALNAARRHRADGGSDVAPQRELSPLGFYSHGAEAAAALPQAKGSPQQMQAMLDRAGVKPAEFENSGFESAFAGRPSVTRDEIAQHFKQAMPKVEDRVLKKDETKYSEHTLPGGENYREVLLKHPVDREAHARSLVRPEIWNAMTDDQRQQFMEHRVKGGADTDVYSSSHWEDPNVLAHLRLSDRTGPNGEKILHVEEIQSDWGQEGRKQGWKASPEERALHHAAWAQLNNNREELDQLRNKLVTEAGLPDHANQMLAVRNLSPGNKQHAMEEYTDRVTQILQHPEYQAASERRDNLYQKLKPSLIKDEGDIVKGPFVTSTPGWTDLALKRVLKEAADGGYHKVIWTPGAEQAKRWNNEEGLKSYYGQMVPKRLQELIKKHDKNAKIGMTDIMLPPVSGEGHNNPPIQAPGFDMTPQMVKSIRRGQALFKDGGLVDAALNITNPVSVFPKPQRMFPADQPVPGGQYVNAKTKEDMTGHKAAAASIGVLPGGKPYFNASEDAVDETGTPGRGSAMAKTNLFKQKAGWKWSKAPEGHEDTNTIVSVEHRGDHHYALNAHFPKGVDLARYEKKSDEPRLRPTTRGNLTKGKQVGTISVRGREHPVYDHVIVKADGGLVDAALNIARQHKVT